MSPHANRHHNNLHQPLRDMDGIVGGNLKRSRSEQTPSPEPRKRPTTFAINDDPSDQQQAQPHSPGNLGSTLTIGRDGGRSRNAQYQLQQALHLGGGGGGAATAESSSSPTRVVNPISSSVSAFGFVRPRSPQPSHHRSSSKRGSRSKSRRRHNDNTLTGHHSSTSNNESSSSSSSGNTSSEDGDDGDGYTGNKAHSIVGLHGSIHDLFMQLEKTRSKYARYSDKAKEASKSIQVLGRKLERRFRDLNEMTTLQQQEHMRQQQQIAQQQQQQQQQQPPSSRQERPLNHRKSSSSISTTTLSSLPMSKSTSARGSTSTSTTADASRIVLDDDDSNESDVVMEQAAAPSRSSFSRAAAAQTITNNTTKGGGSRSTRRRIQTDPDDEILPASLSVVDTLTNTRIKFKPKVFSRKPRGLLMPNEFGGLGMEEVMVTSSLDGIVQFWDMKSQTSMGTISKERLSNPFAEDMCWVGKDVLAIATGSLKESEQRNQMVLVHVNGGGGGGQSSRKTKNTNGTMKINGGLSWSLQGLQESPHDKSGVSIITPFRNSGGGSSSSSALSFFTGGVDKKLFQWNFATESSTAEGLPFLKPTSQRLIHQKHSSGIQALCFSTYHQRLFSGGQDCKLIGWDLQHEQSVEQFREMDMGRINHILQNPQDPHLFLVCHASTQQQLHLYDSRQERQSVLDFGYHSSENLSRYVTPSWHPRGSLVSLGSQAAEGNTTNLSMFGGGGGGGGGNTGGGSTGGGGSSKINLWDIRWKNVGRGAGQSIEVHGKRILKAAFHPNRDLLVSMSTDNSLAFTDYTLNLGTVVN